MVRNAQRPSLRDLSFIRLQREGGLRDARESALRFLETLSSSLDARTENEHVERSVRDAIGQLKVRLVE